MSLLKKLFTPAREVIISDYDSFWKWFSFHEKEFYSILQSRTNVDTRLMNRLLPALHKLNPGLFCVCGIGDDDTTELIISAEGNVKNFVFAEDLISKAPMIPGWRFTALKPAAGLDAVSTNQKGYEFSREKIGFYAKKDPVHPDEISLVFVHKDYNRENAQQIENGTFVFLENALGELNLATLIDGIEVSGPAQLEDETIALEKLIPYLKWREAEFVEKYKGGRYNTEADRYATFSGQDSNGFTSIGLMNTDLLQWDAKGSHPWMMTITINYAGNHINGMPDKQMFRKMDRFEKDLCDLLVDEKGYLNIGRQTYNGMRTVYFACAEFRHASRIAKLMIAEYRGVIDADYTICRDKYWMTVEKFSSAC
ncbi:DUF695 domain-containing protein [Terrimonas sp. NA20]|uniref:DUF695 domain-containing protein n=1 Tax=Terrimonas ginsenosidimutans TaxID=2908004 RepID=A0ABS9KKS3_9BACT|nr:DUF695 domain-containing protein [Terrimonas ginsenosidimutans]MCG2612924.1 DUF695 domain-containing protein [Terrimonas ginsenosidimutans]